MYCTFYCCENDAEQFTELNMPSLSCCISLSTAKLAAGQQKHLLFEVQPGSDATALWKVAVRVLCTKVRPKNLLCTHHMPRTAAAHTSDFVLERQRETQLEEMKLYRCFYVWEKVWSGRLLSILCVSHYCVYTNLSLRLHDYGQNDNQDYYDQY